jgi:hypothetical protein
VAAVRIVFYVVNLHSKELAKVFTNRPKAAKFAEAHSERTGCTFAVAQGVLFFQPMSRKACPHLTAANRDGVRQCRP